MPTNLKISATPLVTPSPADLVPIVHAGVTSHCVASALGGGTDLGWFNVEDYGAVTSTESTVAIQAAMNACEAAGGGTVWFPNPPYTVGGALQDTSRSNSQLLLPRRDGVTAVALTIVLRGPFPAEFQPCIPVLGGGSIPLPSPTLLCTLNTSSGTDPACIGAWGPVTSSQDFSLVEVVLRDFSLQMPANPVLTAIDLGHCTACDIDEVAVNAGNWYVPGISAQTTSTSYGVKTPRNNNGAKVRVGSLGIIGFYNGISVNEHLRADGLSIMACKQAMVYLAANHSSWMGKTLIQHCQKAMVFTGGAHYFTIDDLNLEHAASGTWTPVYDIDDASNFGHGDLKWSVVLAGSGQSAIFTVNGATNVLRARLGSIPAPAAHAFRAYQSAATTLTPGVPTKVACNTESFDPSNEYDSTTNYRFTPTVAGLYQVNAIVGFQDAGPSVTAGQAYIYLNGAFHSGGTFCAPNAGGVWSAVSDVLSLNGSTDYIEMFAYCTGGAPPLKAQSGDGFSVFSAVLISP